MSAIDSFRAPAMGQNFGFGARALAALSHWVDVRSTRNALNGLTDRELDDIGLCRGDIDRIARGL